ncbi:MAG: hypothetical protein M1837_002799 [Sclerophora amabilis]|nr:MAG: hypothetical protein M1837_002799 [Sclerophora amabilis]
MHLPLFSSLASRPVVHVSLVLALACITTFLYRLLKVRRKMLALKRQGLSITPYNPLFGSLLVTKDRVATLPADVNPQYLPHHIRRSHPDVGSLFYLDNWPFIAPILVVSSPYAAHQATQEHSLPKFPAMRKFIRPIAGEYDLVTLEGPMWKTWRGIFSPGFSAAHLTSLVPDIVSETMVFCDILREKVEGNAVFSLKKLTDNLAMDVIGRVVLDTRFNCQRTNNPLAAALRRQIPWLSFGTELNIWQRWHPVRPIMHWYNTRIMDKYITKELNSRYAIQKDRNELKRSKSIIDLALKSYLQESATNDSNKSVDDSMDPAFKSFIVGHIKSFLFTGHDTTSSSICYTLHLLSQHPSALHRLRAEHDTVFTADTAATSSLVSQKPHLLNQLPFTLAVIKETLRLFPVVSSTRSGESGFSIISEDGTPYPTDGCLVWSLPHAIQRDSAYWPSPDTFIPERWLAAPGDPLYPVKGAWRPFEFGPRNCIGQELAMLEIKIALVLTARELNIRSVYEEFDKMKPRKGPKTVAGERAYQAISGGPSDGLPCRVERVAATPAARQS